MTGNDILGWQYAFDCKNCSEVKRREDGASSGDYCMATLRGDVTIHADGDRILKCDAYKPIKRGRRDDT